MLQSLNVFGLPGVSTYTEDLLQQHKHAVSFTWDGKLNGVQVLRTEANMTSTVLPTVYLNQTESGQHFNDTGETEHPMFDNDDGIGTLVIVSITLGSAAVIVVIVILVVCFVRKKCHKKKEQAWVDNLTLSYIADSNIDLTKDNFDEMTSLDNDNFLNSLDTGSFSVWSPDSNSRQYSYSYF